MKQGKYYVRILLGPAHLTQVTREHGASMRAGLEALRYLIDPVHSLPLVVTMTARPQSSVNLQCQRLPTPEYNALNSPLGRLSYSSKQTARALGITTINTTSSNTFFAAGLTSSAHLANSTSAATPFQPPPPFCRYTRTGGLRQGIGRYRQSQQST